MTTAPLYDRAVLVDVLVYHYRKDITSCGCGWNELGRSWPEHVATVFEESVTARASGPAGPSCPPAFPSDSE